MILYSAPLQGTFFSKINPNNNHKSTTIHIDRGEFILVDKSNIYHFDISANEYKKRYKAYSFKKSTTFYIPRKHIDEIIYKIIP